MCSEKRWAGGQHAPGTLAFTDVRELVLVLEQTLVLPI